MSNDFPLTLYYDAACPVCSLEMQHLQSRDRSGRLVLVDISGPGFDAGSTGFSRADADAVIHAVRPDGTIVRGLAALRLAYAAVGLGWLLRPSAAPLLRPLCDAAYRVFARHRRPISTALAPLLRAVAGRRARDAAARMAAGIGACGGAGGRGRCTTAAAPAGTAAPVRSVP